MECRGDRKSDLVELRRLLREDLRKRNEWQESQRKVFEASYGPITREDIQFIREFEDEGVNHE